MPPKSGKEVVEDEDEVLQAVILADSFNSRFQPLSTTKPRTLLPLCNIPLLDWTVEALVSSGVQEIFVFCCSHAEKIKEAIRVSRWSLPNSGVSITPIVTPEANSVGDVMRELDTKQIITSDFILVTGDVVSTIPLQAVLREHKERRKASKDCIMTMVYKPAGPRDRPRPGLDSSILLLDTKTHECLYYEYVASGHTIVSLPREKLNKRTDVDVRTDLLDCSIDVCSVDVPPLFSENFDYQDLRVDFVHGVLTSDILGKTIYCHIPPKGYAARVRDTRSYAAISQDVLSRRTFPLVPDDTPEFRFKRGLVYLSDPLSLSRTCTIGSHTQIGRRTTIDDDAFLDHSVIGEDCSIGRGTKIQNTYIWASVTIGAGCIVEDSIIANGVKIGRNSRISRGCLIGEGTVLGENANLAPFSRVAASPPTKDDEEEDDNMSPADPSVVGFNTQAYLWPEEEKDDASDSEDDTEHETLQTRQFNRLGNTNPHLAVPESDESSTSEASSPEGSQALSLDGDVPKLSLDDNSAAASDFRSECTQSLERAFDEGHTVDNAAIELKTLRMASNVPLGAVKEVVVEFIASRIQLSDSAAEQKKLVNRIIDRWGGLIQGIGGEDPVETIVLLQAYCAKTPVRLKLFGNVLAAFYNADVVEDEDIKLWLLDSRSKYAVDTPGDTCRKQGVILFKAIEAQSSEDDDDDDDDEEEDEDD
ncbi:hypothetical protein BS47DRAFT_1378549 [Hydnum rufescens UP504]|uniref:Translation initiation factor eIF2B subunit epsilon n=1 Tax=Hydnum rufescens UP504 TaxID=1448309 RepID=A0A9P6BBF9_9AGAM|nr:hypothetical protein BS47DRAFT_1378549 [Hydnum rufescens UP504]